MPQIIGNKVGVTIPELEPWYKYDALKKSIKRHQAQRFGIKKLVKAAPGHCMQVDFDTLPTYIQDALGDPRKCDHILERFYKIDSEAVTFYSTFQFDDNSYLSIEHQERYIANASVLKAVIHLKAARQSERHSKGININKDLIKTLCEDTASFNNTLNLKHKITHSLPKGEKAFKQCLNAFEESKYQSLVSGKHKSQNARKVTDETVTLLQNIFATDRTKPTAREVHRRYQKFLKGDIEILINNGTGECYNPANYKALSPETINKYLSTWESKIGTYALRSGDRQKYMGKFKPHHSMDRPEFAGSLISIDDRQPPFKATNGKRIWFYNAYDVASGSITCWVYGPTKEGIIKDFYRQLLRNYHEWGFNLPNELEAEMSLNSSFVDTFLREGAMFQSVRIEANNARGKIIERTNGTLRNEIEKELDGFLPRPFAKKESNQPGPYEIPTLPYKQIIEQCLGAIETLNNKPHPTEPTLSRWEYFQQRQHPNLSPTNYLAILPHLGHKTNTSCNVGIVHLDNGEYLLGDNGKVALGQKLINLMHRVEGKKIEVCWLDDNKGKIFKALIFIRDQYICEAIAKPTYNRAKIEQTPACFEAREIMSAYVATIESYGKKQKQAIDQVTILDNTPKPERTFIMPGLKHYSPNPILGIELPDTPPVDNYAEDDDPLEALIQLKGNWRGLTTKERFLDRF